MSVGMAGPVIVAGMTGIYLFVLLESPCMCGYTGGSLLYCIAYSTELRGPLL